MKSKKRNKIFKYMLPCALLVSVQTGFALTPFETKGTALVKYSNPRHKYCVSLGMDIVESGFLNNMALYMPDGYIKHLITNLFTVTQKNNLSVVVDSNRWGSHISLNAVGRVVGLLFEGKGLNKTFYPTDQFECVFSNSVFKALQEDDSPYGKNFVLRILYGFVYKKAQSKKDLEQFFMGLGESSHINMTDEDLNKDSQARNIEKLFAALALKRLGKRAMVDDSLYEEIKGFITANEESSTDAWEKNNFKNGLVSSVHESLEDFSEKDLNLFYDMCSHSAGRFKDVESLLTAKFPALDKYEIIACLSNSVNKKGGEFIKNIIKSNLFNSPKEYVILNNFINEGNVHLRNLAKDLAAEKIVTQLKSINKFEKNELLYDCFVRFPDLANLVLQKLSLEERSNLWVCLDNDSKKDTILQRIVNDSEIEDSIAKDAINFILLDLVQIAKNYDVKALSSVFAHKDKNGDSVFISAINSGNVVAVKSIFECLYDLEINHNIKNLVTDDFFKDSLGYPASHLVRHLCKKYKVLAKESNYDASSFCSVFTEVNYAEKLQKIKDIKNEFKAFTKKYRSAKKGLKK